MINSKIALLASRPPRRFYWWVILPLQTLLLTAYAAPLYGFNALIAPINILFAGDQLAGAWQGAWAGGLMLLGSGFGALWHGRLLQLTGSPLKLLIALSIATCVVFAIGALAADMQSIWLLLFGFAFPTGLIFSNLFALCIYQTMEWGRQFNNTGLQAGVVGFCFGLWGAVFSYFGVLLVQQLGLSVALLLVGLSIMLIGFLASCFFILPPHEQASDRVVSDSNSAATSHLQLTTRQLFRLAPYWLFALFFLFFLIPGFGFKIIVQELSTHVFNADAKVSAIMATAFLASYGLSRLLFGILSDRLNTRLLYLGFSFVQSVSLLIAAMTLSSNQSILLFTILMCLVGSSFAAGKSLWVLVLLKLYGPLNYNTAVHATLPAFGLAGLLGPVSLNYALGQTDLLTATGFWLYLVAGLLAICILLFMMLKKIDYQRIARGESQPLSIAIRSTDPLARF